FFLNCCHRLLIHFTFSFLPGSFYLALTLLFPKSVIMVFSQPHFTVFGIYNPVGISPSAAVAYVSFEILCGAGHTCGTFVVFIAANSFSVKTLALIAFRGVPVLVSSFSFCQIIIG